MIAKYFKTDKGILLPVNEKKYLIPFLTGTTKGTKYYDPPPSNVIKKEYFADKLLQFHQFRDLFSSIGVNLEYKSFLDIGTGNGLFPKTLLITGLMKDVLGSDLYSPYEHESASIPLEKQVSSKYINFLKNNIRKNILSYDNYKKTIKGTAEKEIFKPKDVLIKNIDLKKLKKYKFKKVGAHNLKSLVKKFDIIYCKGIEHIHNWKLVVKNISYISKKNSYVYLKIRPFYSYLGPHRFATSSIPWGHALLSDREYRRYINQFHKDRAKQMISSYFNTLTFPRHTIEELIRFFELSNFSLICQKIETPPFLKTILKFKNSIKRFDKILNKNGKISNSELSSSSQHLVFQKL